MNKKSIIVTATSFLTISLTNRMAQIHHEHHKNELGIALAPVYFINEKESSFGLHIHYIHHLDDSEFGLGLGYERIFDEHEHNTIAATVNYRFTDRLSPGVSPGITFEGGDESEGNFALHLESVYEF